jgi:sugar-specific transcriptional regulator TrmB
MMDLRRLGFTPTESRVYVSLLTLSPATGYAVAQAAGLARANTYAALEGLAARGAVSRLPGRPARYAAVEPEALIGRARLEFSQDLESLGRQLSAIERRQKQEAPRLVEALVDGAAVLRAAAACARSAREELLAVVGPWASDAYRDLEAARGRRVATRLLSLGAPAPEGAVVRVVATGEIEAYWGGLPIALVADRSRAVCGVVQSGGRASGIAAEHPGVVPFLRHLLMRELASAAPARVS